MFLSSVSYVLQAKSNCSSVQGIIRGHHMLRIPYETMNLSFLAIFEKCFCLYLIISSTIMKQIISIITYVRDGQPFCNAHQN